MSAAWMSVGVVTAVLLLALVLAVVLAWAVRAAGELPPVARAKPDPPTVVDPATPVLPRLFRVVWIDPGFPPQDLKCSRVDRVRGDEWQTNVTAESVAAACAVVLGYYTRAGRNYRDAFIPTVISGYELG